MTTTRDSRPLTAREIDLIAGGTFSLPSLPSLPSFPSVIQGTIANEFAGATATAYSNSKVAEYAPVLTALTGFTLPTFS